MAITTAAGDGVRITSAAKNGTLGSQTGIASDEIRFDTSITAVNNGNLEATPTFAGRKVILRRGLSGEEERYIVAVNSGNAVQVNEAWSSAPVSGDSYDISYVCEDAATVTGFALLSKRVTDYGVGRLFSVGNNGGGTFSFFSLTDGYSIEGDNGIGANESDFTVEASARFSIGYDNSGNPVSGGYLISTADTAGEGCVAVSAGGELIANDFFCTCVQNNKTRFRGRVYINKGKIYAGTYDGDFTGDVTLNNFTFEGRSSTIDSMTISGSTVINGLNLISNYGIQNASVAHSDTLTVKDPVWVIPKNEHYLTVHSSGIFNVVNPIWGLITSGASSQASALIFTDTTGEAHELWRTKYSVTDAGGSAISSAVTWIYASSYKGATASTPSEYKAITNAVGSTYVDVETRGFTALTNTTASVTYQAGFTAKIYSYGKRPYFGALASATANNVNVGLPVDANITQPTAASALSVGAGVSAVVHSPNPATALAYASGTTTFTLDAVVSGQTTGAEGTVREYLGDATSGTIFLYSRNGTAFSGNEELWQAGARIAEASTSFNEDYTWEVNASSNNMTAVYDYMSARMAEETPGDVYKQAITWGRGEYARMIFNGANGYYTNVVASAGVWVSRRGTGTIDYFTADSGNIYTPPVQYTFSVTNLISDSEVRILHASTGAEIAGTDSSGTTFNYSYTYGGSDIPIVVVIFHLSYAPRWVTNLTLSNSDYTLLASQQTDRVYNNP